VLGGPVGDLGQVVVAELSNHLRIVRPEFWISGGIARLEAVALELAEHLAGLGWVGVA